MLAEGREGLASAHTVGCDTGIAVTKLIFTDTISYHVPDSQLIYSLALMGPLQISLNRSGSAFGECCQFPVKQNTPFRFARQTQAKTLKGQ